MQPSSDDVWKAGVITAAVSDIGMRRRNNQDSYSVVLADSQDAWQRSGHLFIVADGMGAHAAGELASRLAVEQIPHHYQKIQKTVPAETLLRAITASNSEIFRRGQANPEFRNMGTTTSTLAFLPEGAVVAHVGDSRVYRCRGKQFEQITFDHSLVWEMQASGEVNEETIRSGIIPKNVITRSLGPNPSVQIDLEGPFPLQLGDRYLLCSDGLTGQVQDEEIGVILQLLPVDQSAQVLVDLANLRGGPDNITVVVVEVSDATIVTQGAARAASIASDLESPRKKFSTALGIVAGICLLTSLVLFVSGNWPLAIVTVILGAIAIATGLVQKHHSLHPTEPQGDRYGRAPYRQYSCQADKKLVDQLSETIQLLREAAEENQWSLDWTTLNQLAQQASTAEAAKNPSQAVVHYSRLLVDLMKQVRDQRNRSANDSSVEL